MTQRAPSARAVGVGFLERFVLRWNKRSKDGSGKCSIEETGRREDFVWGVVYEMSEEDKAKLDVFEGLGRGYGERQVTVLIGASHARIHTYYATSIDPSIRPYDWYRELVIAGAREHNFPAPYIEALEAVAVISDPDSARAAKARAVIREKIDTCRESCGENTGPSMRR